MKLKHGMTMLATAITMVVGGGPAVATAGAAAAPERAPFGTPDSRIGMAILAGGGVTDFTQETTRNETGVGGSWDVRAMVGTRCRFGFELSYINGANAIKGLGLSDSSKLVRNGIEGALRLQAPLYQQKTLLEPYIFGGLGWNAYRVTNVDPDLASVTKNGDNTVAVPLGVGFMVGYRGFVADLRYTVRPTYQQTLLAGQGANGLTNWDAGAMIGFEF
jgi:Outer membrane protein beta-barrel domain